jgi:hypothetical protein
MAIPDLHRVNETRYRGWCGRCLKFSEYVDGDITEAWAHLEKIGWSIYSPAATWGSRPYAICPVCTTTPFSIELAVKRAHRSRKRK